MYKSLLKFYDILKIKCGEIQETQVVAVKDIQHNIAVCIIYYKITENCTMLMNQS